MNLETYIKINSHCFFIDGLFDFYQKQHNEIPNHFPNWKILSLSFLNMTFIFFDKFLRIS